MNENKVLQALEALAENDRRQGVPPIVEIHLLRAFRARRPKRAFPSWAAVCSIAAAAALLTVVTVQRQPPHSVALYPDNRAHAASAALARDPGNAAAARTTTRAATIETQKAGVRPVMPKAARVKKPTVRKDQITTEMVTDFFPLMDPAPPFDRGEILRVQLPATAMQAVGLPVSDDHLADQIQADVLVGEEGLPRAIRFVKFEMK